MEILITGPGGFIAKNLQFRLKELGFKVNFLNKNDISADLNKVIDKSDFIFHLAGVNRADRVEEFRIHNEELTKILCEALAHSNKKIPILFASSIQAGLNNPYGKSKLSAENHLINLSKKGNKVFIFRLPNVFGKWSRPNYNSVVATFCHNVINELPIQINDPSSKLQLIYIDDLLDLFIDLLGDFENQDSFVKSTPYEEISVSNLAKTIKLFKDSTILSNVGIGLTKKLYSTYLSFKNPNRFSYKLSHNSDSRGIFVEFIKTESSGQISYFTMNPGAARGGHYHHTKNEKFLVVKGEILFNFSNLISTESFGLKVSSASPEVVETVPGWSHELVNISNIEAIVILWANEILIKESPDTFLHKALL